MKVSRPVLKTSIPYKGQPEMDLLSLTELPDLVQAIVGGNTRVLAKTPGVGPKTAERIALELKNKLSEWRQDAGLTTSVPVGVMPAIQEEVEMTLLALGYTAPVSYTHLTLPTICSV